MAFHGLRTPTVTSRHYYSTLPEATKIRICQLIEAMAGLKSREIANRLGIDKRELNKFLWKEGKEIWGLYERNWRWYRSAHVQPHLPMPPHKTDEPKDGPLGGCLGSSTPNGDQLLQPQTVCGILMAMGQLEAIRQIRRLDRLAIEKAFSEEEYLSIPDVLKIELVQRLEQLKSEAVGESKRPGASHHPLVTLALIAAAIPIVIKLLDLLSK
jgi:hypothetical protein